MSESVIKKYLFAVFIVCVLSNNITSQPKVFYVATNGSDRNKGLSIDDPLSTISTAIENASAGDTIYVLPGTYSQVIYLEGKKGLPEKPVCIYGYSNHKADYPVLDGGGLVPSVDTMKIWMSLKNCEWIEISGISFINGWTFPIKLNNSSYISFQNCRFKGGKRVISASGLSTHHILVENCFWDQGGEDLWRLEKDKSGVDAWTSMHHGDMSYFNGSIIDFSGTGGSIVIRNNTITNAFNAIRFRGQKGCDSNVEIYNNDISNVRDNDFEPEYYTYNVHIYHNRSHNIHRTLSIDNVEGGKIYYYGNVITTDNDPWSKLICSGFWKVYATERLLSFPVYAFNNSFYGSGRSFSAGNSKTNNFRHYNNAYFYTVSDGWALKQYGENNEFDYDISNALWPVNLSANAQEKHGKIADVKYVDPGNKDLRLKPGSPCLDAGKTLSLKEFDWTQSYKGLAPEIGAFEDGELVEGPVFRFIVPPDGKINYQEKPRIVRQRIQDNKLYLYFSSPIDPLTISKGAIKAYNGKDDININKVSFPNNNYEMEIETGADLKKMQLALSFSSLPKGLNGERMTFWASAATIYKN